MSINLRGKQKILQRKTKQKWEILQVLVIGWGFSFHQVSGIRSQALAYAQTCSGTEDICFFGAQHHCVESSPKESSWKRLKGKLGKDYCYGRGSIPQAQIYWSIQNFWAQSLIVMKKPIYSPTNKRQSLLFLKPLGRHSIVHSAYVILSLGQILAYLDYLWASLDYRTRLCGWTE